MVGRSDLQFRPMASITKDMRRPPKTPYWIACFTGADGRRLKRSTKTTDAAIARRMADEWERASKAGRAGRLTESQCRKVISDIYELAVGEPLHFLTAKGYLNEWVERKKSETEPRTYLKYSQTVREFLDHVGNKAGRLLREIAAADIRSWRDKLKRDGHSAPTVNDLIKILRMPFRAAPELGYIDVNPCAKVAVGPVKDKVRNVSRDAFTRE